MVSKSTITLKYPKLPLQIKPIWNFTQNDEKPSFRRAVSQFVATYQFIVPLLTFNVTFRISDTRWTNQNGRANELTFRSDECKIVTMKWTKSSPYFTYVFIHCLSDTY